MVKSNPKKIQVFYHGTGVRAGSPQEFVWNLSNCLVFFKCEIGHTRMAN